VSSLCERIFGTKLYANIVMLGVAYQRGLVPVSLEAMRDGIRKSVRADLDKNLRAFDVGRKFVTNPELFGEIFSDGRASHSLARVVRAKAAYLNMRLLGRRASARIAREPPASAGSPTPRLPAPTSTSSTRPCGPAANSIARPCATSPSASTT